MKVPPKRKGNLVKRDDVRINEMPSMKVPPKRKGNPITEGFYCQFSALNESPSEKEGKFCAVVRGSPAGLWPSMKVPPKRKGNAARLGNAHL